MVAGIATAAVLIPLIALAALFCCWRRRHKRKEGEFKAGSRAAVSGAGGAGGLRDYGREGKSDLSSLQLCCDVVDRRQLRGKGRVCVVLRPWSG